MESRHNGKLTETFAIQASPKSRASVCEAFDDNLPKVIYPEIRAITANKGTRNKTYYPVENLTPNPDGTRGISTFLWPYPKPILSQHDSDGTSAPVYGRARYVSLAETSDKSKKYVSLIPAITDPEAIEKILDGRFMTVSIGCESDWVKCSICGINVREGYCDHTRGEPYKLTDGTIGECLWEIGPMQFEELSFVISPSDVDARVLKVNMDVNSVPIIKAEHIDLGKHYLESRKKSFFLAVNESHRICESMGATPDPEDDERAEDEVDRELTYGDLYDLDEDDPDFNLPVNFDEKTLTKKQRDAMPSGAFCGPGRSFPAGDASHARVGLSMLSRYKGSGDKGKIKACLQRKLAKFNGGENALLTLTDKKNLAEFHLLHVSAGNTQEMGALIEDSQFPEIVKEGMRTRLAFLCKEFEAIRPKSVEAAYQGLVGAVRPYEVELNAETYPILYSVIEALSALHLEEEKTMSEEIDIKPEDTQAPPAEVLESTSTEIVETPVQEGSNDLVEARAELVSLQAEKEALTNAVSEARGLAHLRLAEMAALLAHTLRKPVAREKELAAVATELSKRSEESLKDTVSDLLAEYTGSDYVPTNIPRVVNPVVAAAEASGVSETTVTLMEDLGAQVTFEEEEVLSFVLPGYKPNTGE